MNTNTCSALPVPARRLTLCVYCGSRSGENPTHLAVAHQVGTWLGRHGMDLVYGGGHLGLMGAVADAALAAGARVIGVIPQALVDMEAAHTGCTELHVVDNMHQRKQKMAECADAFLALPGGIGTFEELFEVWTWRQLGYHQKPIGLLNHAGYYDGLLGFMEHTVSAGFLRPWQMGLIQVGTEASVLLPALQQSAQSAANETVQPSHWQAI